MAVKRAQLSRELEPVKDPVEYWVLLTVSVRRAVSLWRDPSLVYPEGLLPAERIHPGVVLEGLQPMGRTHAGAGEKCEEEQQRGQFPSGLKQMTEMLYDPELRRQYFEVPDAQMSGIECIFRKFADNTNLSGAVDSLEGRDAIQKDLDSLEECACANLKVQQGQVQGLYDSVIGELEACRKEGR
ncbi:hypothetical protein llap_3196 [Limosa lapponica baueri]|uniref:Uncharacterized protein n=1 Tax=Limosa lapponica baueri TaxID=1758121 RepID=A0A2I0UKF1_LIMLA|nr:hypothetical protein llap_3196 [Limosa lapponica baueri]